MIPLPKARLLNPSPLGSGFLEPTHPGRAISAAGFRRPTSRCSAIMLGYLVRLQWRMDVTATVVVGSLGRTRLCTCLFFCASKKIYWKHTRDTLDRGCSVPLCSLPLYSLNGGGHGQSALPWRGALPHRYGTARRHWVRIKHFSC